MKGLLMNKWLFLLCAFFTACQQSTLHLPPSEYRITTEDLYKWDAIVETLPPLERSGDTFRLYAYLFTAQKAFADASFNHSNDYAGTLDPISTAVIQLFIPTYSPSSSKTDAYSEQLSKELMGPIRERFESEEKNIRSITPYEKEGHWTSETIPTDRYIPSMKPWKMKTQTEFRSPRPPPNDDPYWNGQLADVKKHMNNATERQKERSLYWENITDPDGSNWRKKGLEYMKRSEIPLEMQLKARADLTMALVDAMIAVYNDKFTYFVSRPFMRDSKLKPLFTTPNHPSYPAAHSTIGGAAETILCYFFPENGKEWRALAFESSESRLWGGIHYRPDLDAGKAQGAKVGKAVLFR
jgi:hypothetical protein